MLGSSISNIRYFIKFATFLERNELSAYSTLVCEYTTPYTSQYKQHCLIHFSMNYLWVSGVLIEGGGRHSNNKLLDNGTEV